MKNGDKSLQAVKVRVGENIRQPAGIEENTGGVMYIYTRAVRGGSLWRPAASLVGCMRCQVL